MADYRCMFSTSDQHHKLNQLRWQNMSAHLTNETSNWLMQLPMHLNWAIYNVSDLYIDPHVCFFPDLVTESGSAKPVSTARGVSATQREACMRSLTTQKPKRLPVGTFSTCAERLRGGPRTATADGCRPRSSVPTTADPQRDCRGSAVAHHQHIPSTNIYTRWCIGVTDLGVMLLWSSADNGIWPI